MTRGHPNRASGIGADRSVSFDDGRPATINGCRAAALPATVASLLSTSGLRTLRERTNTGIDRRGEEGRGGAIPER